MVGRIASVRVIQTLAPQSGYQMLALMNQLICEAPLLLQPKPLDDERPHLGFQPAHGGSQSVVREFPMGVSGSKMETHQKNGFYSLRECGRFRRSRLRHFVGAVDQMPVKGLVKCLLELIVDAPAVMNDQSFKLRPRELNGLVVAPSRQDPIDGRAGGDCSPELPPMSPDFPIRLVHADDAGDCANLADKVVLGRFALRTYSCQGLAKPARCQAKVLNNYLFVSYKGGKQR